MRLGIGSGGEGSSLAVRLAWLTALRLFVLTAFLVLTATVYLGGFRLGGYSSILVLITVAVAYAVAGAYALLLRLGRAHTPAAYAQLVTDQATWTAIVYISGGAASGATSLYGLTCLCGAILLGVRGALVAFLAAAIAYGGLCAGFVLELVLPPSDQPFDAYATAWDDVRYPFFVNLLAVAFVTVLASYLAERLRATGGRLVQATERAEKAERLAALGRLSAALAHEIRNPLGSIAGSIELLRTGGSLTEEDRKLCHIIERETARLNDLVGDMLDLARPRAPAMAPVELGTLCRDIVRLSATTGRGQDVAVRYEGPDDANVVADAAQLRQVVWNLLRNAIQASSAGDQVVVALQRSAAGFRLTVRDHGAGIPPEVREKLFEAFFTTRSHGVGIGLAVVKRIADDHGFSLEIETGEGKGTAFSVLLPASAEVEVGRGQPDEAGVLSGGAAGA